ncbi:MAG TPA: hypothetical protein VLL82_10140 [Mycobacterium sp.]|nr:hypothetical protein [Mycobacterium sp.]
MSPILLQQGSVIVTNAAMTTAMAMTLTTATAITTCPTPSPTGPGHTRGTLPGAEAGPS